MEQEINVEEVRAEAAQAERTTYSKRIEILLSVHTINVTSPGMLSVKVCRSSNSEAFCWTSSETQNP